MIKDAKSHSVSFIILVILPQVSPRDVLSLFNLSTCNDQFICVDEVNKIRFEMSQPSSVYFQGQKYHCIAKLLIIVVVFRSGVEQCNIKFRTIPNTLSHMVEEGKIERELPSTFDFFLFVCSSLMPFFKLSPKFLLW